jgi:hypothetical protein
LAVCLGDRVFGRGGSERGFEKRASGFAARAPAPPRFLVELPLEGP